MILTPSERLAQAVKGMANGTFRGASNVASPFNPLPAGIAGLHSSLSGSNFPFIVVADDGSGDFTSIKDAIEATTETVSADVGGRFIWVKPHSTGGVYDDGGAGDVSTGGRNFYVFSPSGSFATRPTGGTNGFTDWEFDGFTSGTSAAFCGFEGLFLNAQGTSSNRLLTGTGSANYYFRRCQIQGSGSIVGSGTDSNAAFYNCQVGMDVFRDSTTYGASLVFEDCQDLNFSPSGAAVTITGDANIYVRNSQMGWRDWTIVGAAGNTNGNLIFQDCALGTGTGGSSLTVSDIQNIFVSGVVDNYGGGLSANFGTWEFSSSGTVDRQRTCQFSGNSLRFIGLVFTTAAANNREHMAVSVHGRYRFLETGVSFTVANVALASGNAATVTTYVTVNNGCVSCNIQAAVDGNNSGTPVAGSIAYNLEDNDHILTLSGYATCGTASTPAPGAGPPTTEINGTLILTITN